ncbi:hypothetical protein LOAG_11081 [Loa loa]|uniref:Uncharacterized protein n=1 Tax=Loa loa TaxID=7209 RepID=A0A1S0TP69_LOALO|nr:hypothetical protein LOAG_11081 [Loa loa]EFO17420.2 hypothetical protein LOAG_11081 [Loa loa]
METNFTENNNVVIIREQQKQNDVQDTSRIINHDSDDVSTHELDPSPYGQFVPLLCMERAGLFGLKKAAWLFKNAAE